MAATDADAVGASNTVGAPFSQKFETQEIRT
jgi:hypothetical protein